MGVKICPNCNGKVSNSRNTCPHCNYQFDNSIITCPDCNEEVKVGTAECPICGHTFKQQTFIGKTINRLKRNKKKVLFVSLWVFVVWAALGYFINLIVALSQSCAHHMFAGGGYIAGWINMGIGILGTLTCLIIMLKRKIKNLSTLLASVLLLIIIGLVPFTYYLPVKYNYQEIANGEIEITSICYTYEKNIKIPSVINGKKVTSIGNRAFYGRNHLESVTIPKSITNIGEYAFAGTSMVVHMNLASVTFEEGSQLKSIGSHAFYGCENLTSIVIPKSVTTIGDYAFAGGRFFAYMNLENVTFEEGSQLESIGNRAFQWGKLSSIEIPNSVTSIGSGAFEHCDNLESVYINDMSAWCNIAFSGPLVDTAYDMFANPLYYGANLYLNNELVTDLVIPDGVTSIKPYAFYGYKSLTGITIPISVTSIGNHAFDCCTNLTHISYDGTKEQWRLISGNNNVKDQYTIYLSYIIQCADGQIDLQGDTIVNPKK